MGHTGCVGEDLLVLAGSGSLSPLVVNSMTRCVESFVYLICITVTVFAVVNQLAVAQGANTTLPLTYHGQVLQLCCSTNYAFNPRCVWYSNPDSQIRVVSFPLPWLFFLFWVFRYAHAQLRSFYSLSTFDAFRVTKYTRLSVPAQLQCLHSWAWEPGNRANTLLVSR